MVFSDSQNDIEMFSLKSNSYVMTNALNKVKKYAYYENRGDQVINKNRRY